MAKLTLITTVDKGAAVVLNTKIVEPANDHIDDTAMHFTTTEKADNARRDLNFRRKLRMGGIF